MTTTKHELVKTGRHPGVRLLARADCTFPSGEVRRLFVTEMSPKGATVLAMRPPRLGICVSIKLSPPGMNPLPSIKARVVDVRLDPAYAERSGFEVVFTDLEEKQIDALSIFLSSIGGDLTPLRSAPRERVNERREHPRIRVNLKGIIEMTGEEREVDFINLSMSGALLSILGNPTPETIKVDAKLVL
ncbi:MAG: PilZ domain-containing protein, partial [Pseudomonadota bacterium]